MLSYHHITLPFYTEGPAADAQGNIYCTTLSGGTILKIDNENRQTVWAKAVCPNGQIILPDGHHLVCDSKEATIIRYSAEGAFIKNELKGKCNDEIIHVPNDLVADQWGGVYFTDSIRQHGKVGYLSPDGIQYILISGLDYPNGIILSADNQKLFIAESYRNRIIVLNLSSPGICEGSYEVFAELPCHSSENPIQNLPDGIAVDHRGYLYVAHYGMQAVQVLNNKGEHIDSMEMPFPLVSNVFISNEEPHILIVTGGYNEPGPGALLKQILNNSL